MKTIKTNMTLLDVNEHLDIIAKSESIICQSSLIYSDMSISLKSFNEQFKSDFKPREWYFDSIYCDTDTQSMKIAEYIAK